MANEHITSSKQAEQKIAVLKQQIAILDTQMKELQNRYPEFVDTPNHPLNKPFIPKKDSILYIPTLDKNRHYAMKFEDMSRNFDQYHYPVYFTNEESCALFDRTFELLNDLIKFKTMYEPSETSTPNSRNVMWVVYYNPETMQFQKRSVGTEVSTTIYFKNEEIAENCCIWLNYKYKFGDYKNRG